MRKTEILLAILFKISQSLERIIKNSECIQSYQYYYLTPAGMERLESTCMLLIAIGEGLKGVDKITEKQLLVNYPQIDWKGAMGIRDIIAHHYFDLDAEIVFDVIKNDLPGMLATIRLMITDIKEHGIIGG